MYGTFNHKLDVLFHNNTKSLYTDYMFQMRPYSEIMFNFERDLNQTDFCQISDISFGAKTAPWLSVVLTLVVSLIVVR